MEGTSDSEPPVPCDLKADEDRRRGIARPYEPEARLGHRCITRPYVATGTRGNEQPDPNFDQLGQKVIVKIYH